MRQTLLIVIMFVFTLILVVPGTAETYTMEKCIETALQRNIGIISAQNTYDASKWSVYSAWGNLLPTLSVSAGRSESGAEAEDYNTGIFGTSVVSYSAGMSMGRSFSGLGLGTYASIKQNQAQKKSNYFSLVDTRDELILSVKEAYFNVVKTKMLVDVQVDAVRRGEEQLKVAESRYDLGSASLSDVLKAKVSYGNAKLDLISAQNDFEIARANLQYTIGISVAGEIEVVEEFPEKEADISYNEALNEAASRNPSLLKSKSDLDNAKAAHWSARTSFLPSIGYSYSRSTSASEAGDLLSSDNDNTNWSFGLSLSFSIFNGFSDYASLISAGKSVHTSKMSLRDTENSIALEVKQAYLDVQQNTEKLSLNEESVAAAQEDLNIVREKYKLGAATIIEVLDAEVSFKEAQVSQVEAQFDYNLALSRLEKVMGR